MPNLIEARCLPDRGAMLAGLEASKSDRRRAALLMRLFEPFFAIAERGEYPLYPARRLKKADVAQAIAMAMRSDVRGVRFVSLSAPVPRQGWMTDDGYQCYRDVGFAHAIRLSTDPWLETVLKREYGPYFGRGIADRDAADELFRGAFGNTLHKAINGTLFSGAAYPVESTLVHSIAFALTGNPSMSEWMVPLLRLLPRAIPLGVRKESAGLWNVLIA